MSYAEDFGYDAYLDEPQERIKRVDTINGTEVCVDCESRNIKVSRRGKKYCADLCWIEDNRAEK